MEDCVARSAPRPLLFTEPAPLYPDVDQWGFHCMLSLPLCYFKTGVFYSFKLSKMVQKDAEQESEMRAEIQEMKKEQSSISMMDEFARYARLQRKINKMTDKLKTHGERQKTAQQAKMKWIVNIAFYILQAALMISLIWKYYSEPVTVVPSRWIAPVERNPVLFFKHTNWVSTPCLCCCFLSGGVGITCWLVVCNKVVTLGLHGCQLVV
uniref:Guided entry of tail-anchored proteins factor 1 n=1 Tax=Mastacembelus armatus TaxID=205130 RepID=A0A3Q3MZX6_9TELE